MTFLPGPAHWAYKDGRKSHELYWTWRSMIRRCTWTHHRRYEDYGGRGIKVCQRWLDSFWDFVADMGKRPEGHTLDRIDVNGDYEPSNTRWATPKEQCANRRV